MEQEFEDWTRGECWLLESGIPLIQCLPWSINTWLTTKYPARRRFAQPQPGSLEGIEQLGELESQAGWQFNHDIHEPHERVAGGQEFGVWQKNGGRRMVESDILLPSFSCQLKTPRDRVCGFEFKSLAGFVF